MHDCADERLLTDGCLSPVSSYPDREQLQTIYGAYLQPVLQRSLGDHAAWGTQGKVHQLAGSLVQVYEQVGRWSLHQLLSKLSLSRCDGLQ